VKVVEASEGDLSVSSHYRDKSLEFLLPILSSLDHELMGDISVAERGDGGLG